MFIYFFRPAFVCNGLRPLFHALVLARPHLRLLGSSVSIEVEVALDPHLHDFCYARRSRRRQRLIGA